MIVSVDIGGWGGVASDIKNAVKHVRVTSTSHTEADILQLAENGVVIEPTLFGTGGTITTINTTEFAEKIVTWFKKYGKGGTVWTGKSYGDKGGKYFELLNEPENPNFWTDGKTTAGKEAYINLMKVVREALTANFAPAVRPKMLISSDGGYAGPKYGQELIALEPKIRELIDGVTCHPYGGSGSGKVKSGEGNRNRVTQAWTDFGLPVFVTEVGWNTSAKGSPGVSEPFTEAEQVANIASFYKFCWEKGYVKMVVYFNFVDYNPEEYWGLETNATPRVKKPSFYTMREMREKYEEHPGPNVFTEDVTAMTAVSGEMLANNYAKKLANQIQAANQEYDYKGESPPWKTGTVYTAGQFVADEGRRWECILGLTSATHPKADATHWIDVGPRFFGYAGLGYNGQTKNFRIKGSWKNTAVVPLYRVLANTPKVKVWLAQAGKEANNTDKNNLKPILQPKWELVPMPNPALLVSGLPASPKTLHPEGIDSECSVYCPETDEYWEFYKLEQWATTAENHVAGEWKSDQGCYIPNYSQWDGQITWPEGTRAAGLSATHGQLTSADITRVLRGGKINHALGVTVRCAPEPNHTSHLEPATSNDHLENTSGIPSITAEIAVGALNELKGISTNLNLCVGQEVTQANLPAGTKVTSISNTGTTAKLSASASGAVAAGSTFVIVNPAKGYVDAVPEGARFRFPAAATATSVGLVRATEPLAYEIYEAIREHGFIVVDSGSAGVGVALQDPRTLGSPYDEPPNPWNGYEGFPGSVLPTKAEIEAYFPSITGEWADASVPHIKESIEGAKALWFLFPWQTLEQVIPKEPPGAEEPTPEVAIGTAGYPFASPLIDKTSAGRIEFFKVIAKETTTIKELFFHTNEEANTAITALHLGLMADNAGKPGALLGEGTYNAINPVPSNTLISVSGLAIPIVAGTAYWFAVLPIGTAGKLLHYSVANEGGAVFETVFSHAAYTKIEEATEFEAEEKVGPPPMYGVGEFIPPPPGAKVPVVKQRLSKQAVFRSMYR